MWGGSFNVVVLGIILCTGLYRDYMGIYFKIMENQTGQKMENETENLGPFKGAV